MITKEALVTGWNFMRWLRLGLGIFIAFQSILNQDSLAGFIAIIFLFQVVTNTGCCSLNACATPRIHKAKHAKDIQFEEIK